MHCRVHEAIVTVEALDISRAVVPVDSKGVDGRIRIVGIGVQEFHEPTEIVGLARRFAYKVYMVYIGIMSALGIPTLVKPRQKRLLRGTGLQTSAKCARAGQRPVKRDAG